MRCLTTATIINTEIVGAIVRGVEIPTCSIYGARVMASGARVEINYEY